MMTTLTENIKNKRKEKGWTQRELADALGISDKTVSRWESGVQVPDAMIIPDVARLLDTTVSELYGETRKEETVNQNDGTIKPVNLLINKRRTVIFKIISVTGLVILILITMLLCNLDIFRGSIDPYNESVRNVFFYILGGAAVALIINKMLFMLYYQKKDRFQPIYLKTDITFSAPVMSIFCAVILMIFPFMHSVHFSLWYVAAGYLICIGCIFVMIEMKRDLRKAGVSVGKAVSIISLILAGVTVLAFFGAAAGLYFAMPTHEILVTEQGVYTESIPDNLQQTVSYIRNTDYLHYSYYVFLISSVPFLAALMMNLIELMIKKEEL
ncbi:MAG: helix-turn-helix transcriptional regulator [Ruminococcus sp.]|nr:helix-turn-helix transcriptional regulator [Ruminococcus sp.]